jgi:hypothetical protein
MKTGFLALETHPEHAGMVRVHILDKVPELSPQADGAEIRYVARFQDVEAGQMHVQNSMHGCLVNLEQRIYRQSLSEMIACVEADDLDHARVWIDPAIGESESQRIANLVQRRQSHHRQINLIWQSVGIAGLILLVITNLIL